MNPHAVKKARLRRGPRARGAPPPAGGAIIPLLSRAPCGSPRRLRADPASRMHAAAPDARRCAAPTCLPLSRRHRSTHPPPAAPDPPHPVRGDGGCQAVADQGGGAHVHGHLQGHRAAAARGAPLRGRAQGLRVHVGHAPAGEPPRRVVRPTFPPTRATCAAHPLRPLACRRRPVPPPPSHRGCRPAAPPPLPRRL